MKLIEAMKKVKDLSRKAEEIKGKIKDHCSHLSTEKPVYDNQGEMVSGWIQSYSDILKEIMKLRVAIQRTNLNTFVEIEISGQVISKTIAEWIHRRRDLAKMEEMVWRCLTDRNLKETIIQPQVAGVSPIEVRIVRYYVPKQRDEKINTFAAEPSTIDARLEVVNAITDIME